MRLWSLHPRYLDAKGLVACWREGLLARKVLLGETRGYKAHPQLERFRKVADPVAFIDRYLQEVAAEAERRGYSFARGKIGSDPSVETIAVTQGQIDFELEHLRSKIISRDPGRLSALPEACAEPHPLFEIVEGGIEEWEKRD